MRLLLARLQLVPVPKQSRATLEQAPSTIPRAGQNALVVRAESYARDRQSVTRERSAERVPSGRGMQADHSMFGRRGLTRRREDSRIMRCSQCSDLAQSVISPGRLS